MVDRVVEYEADGRSSGDGGGFGSRSRVGIAAHVRGCQGLNGGVVERLADDVAVLRAAEDGSRPDVWWTA